MAASDRDSKLREAAENRGLKLVKSRLRTPGKGDYGRYGLTDAAGTHLLGFGKSGLTATAEEVEAYLHKGVAADWKSSLRAAGARPPRREKAARAESPPEPAGRRRSAPEPAPAPEPEPEPPPLKIRPARPADAEGIAELLAQLGYEAKPPEVTARLSALKKSGETPLVAEQGALIGLLAWHVMPVLHRPRPVGRITMMIVAERERRRGVGRSLVEEASARLVAKGCGLVEVTSNVDLSGAHGFYRRLGFERTSYRFAKALD